MSRHKRKHHQDGVIAVDQKFMVMSEMPRRRAIRAIATGKACILDLRTWARLGVEHLRSLQVLQVIIFPNVQAVPDSRIGLGRDSKAILRRDGYECQFDACTNRADTVDHVVPRVQGGRSNHSNLVASCFCCNQKKGGRTPEQAGMKLKRLPRSPRFALMERLQVLAARAS